MHIGTLHRRQDQTSASISLPIPDPTSNYKVINNTDYTFIANHSHIDGLIASAVPIPANRSAQYALGWPMHVVGPQCRSLDGASSVPMDQLLLAVNGYCENYYTRFGSMQEYCPNSQDGSNSICVEVMSVLNMTAKFNIKTAPGFTVCSAIFNATVHNCKSTLSLDRSRQTFSLQHLPSPSNPDAGMDPIKPGYSFGGLYYHYYMQWNSYALVNDLSPAHCDSSNNTCVIDVGSALNSTLSVVKPKLKMRL